MVEKINNTLWKLFIANWERKLTAFSLAAFIWFHVDQSLTTTKTITDVGIKLINLPQGTTTPGMNYDGLLRQRVALTITGNRALLDELTSNDIEVVVDASGKKPMEWIPIIKRNNIVAINSDIKLSSISKVTHKNFAIRLTKLVTEKILVTITEPIGEAPKGYQFLDVWPYQLYITVEGPEDIVKQQKAKGLKLTFNLNEVSRAELDEFHTTTPRKYRDVVSFLVPDHWKQLHLPALSDLPMTINDPNEKYLRIDFIRSEVFPIEQPIPISLFFSPQFITNSSPQKVQIRMTPTLDKKNGVYILMPPFYAGGISQLFLEIIRDHLALSVVVGNGGKMFLDWNIQVINYQDLENRYVKTLMSDLSQKRLQLGMPLQMYEEHLRGRFRTYMNRLQLYRSPTSKLDLAVSIDNNVIQISEDAPHER